MDWFTFRRRSQFSVQDLARSFRDALPFPHVVLEDVVAAPVERVLAAFPPIDWSGWSTFTDTYQRHKHFCGNIEIIPPPLRDMVWELSSPSFLEFLSDITGIKQLIPDPYLDGGGLHCSGPGGVLKPHTDFHRYDRLGLYRRINVLVYLNPDWQAEYGGCLELYDKGNVTAPVRIVVPRWGTCVIFVTDHWSVHGFSKPIVGEGRYRRSLALYYYTSGETEVFSGDRTTYWREHGAEKLSVHGRAQLRAYRSILWLSNTLGRVAHLINPNRSRPLMGPRR